MLHCTAAVANIFLHVAFTLNFLRVCVNLYHSCNKRVRA